MLCRSNNVGRNANLAGIWTYFRQWQAFGHAQDGTCCYFDIPESQKWPKEIAIEFAVKQGWPDVADRALLEAWRCGLMH